MLSIFVRAVVLGGLVGMTTFQAFAIEEIPEKRMVSRGGVLYPETGDSSQERFQTPENARQLFPPGTLVGFARGLHLCQQEIRRELLPV